ncbi:DEAD/DEAH box helicase, partial [Pseudomonas syringae pv. actinidiae]|nr:DEAD/DEAH box helicase [Pseudomonas syringae pv. actinidiae]
RAANPGRPAGGAPRTGSGTGAPKRNGSGSSAPRSRDSQPRGRRPAREDQPLPREGLEPAVRAPRDGQPQPKIVHKESKIDRFPSAEQLDQLPARPRGEKPALLTRNRDS